MSFGMVAENSSVWRSLVTSCEMRRTSLDEAHVEHAIGFVEDEEGHLAELHVAALDQVEQAARAWRPGCRRRAAGSRSGGRSPGRRRRCRGAGRGRGRRCRSCARSGRRARGSARAREHAGSWAGRGRWWSERCCRIGSAKAAVLPVPVWAMPRTSRPCSSAGMVRAWMGVGTVYLAAARARSNVSDEAEIGKRNITHWENSPYGRQLWRLWLTLRRGGGGSFFWEIVSG